MPVFIFAERWGGHSFCQLLMTQKNHSYSQRKLTFLQHSLGGGGGGWVIHICKPQFSHLKTGGPCPACLTRLFQGSVEDCGGELYKVCVRVREAAGPAAHRPGRSRA